MLKRLFDILLSLIGLLLLSPVFAVISIFILVDSKGGIFFKQSRVGKGEKDFSLFKFRTMRENSENAGLLTIGARDNRVTPVGFYLRKYKLDELPQLINVLLGDMSLVGPRPEVRKYVDMYDSEQKKVLSVKPGITDYASIEYSSENELLAGKSDPEDFYISVVMPEKLKLNLKYIREANLFTDIKIIIRTLLKIW